MQRKAVLCVPPDDSALTAAYWDTVIKSGIPEPERQLMRAVLKLALLDFMNNYRLKNAHFRNARNWLFNGDSENAFSFEAVCSVLGLSVIKIRNYLSRWAEKTHPECLDVFVPNSLASSSPDLGNRTNVGAGIDREPWETVQIKKSQSSFRNIKKSRSAAVELCQTTSP